VNSHRQLPGTSSLFAKRNDSMSPLSTQLLLVQAEHPDGTAGRNGWNRAGRKATRNSALHSLRIDAEAGHYGDVLLPIDGERGRLAQDAGVGRELPKHLTVPRVIG